LETDTAAVAGVALIVVIAAVSVSKRRSVTVS